MANYVNFYENLKEAEMRLKGTIVTYDSVPHWVLCLSDHKSDGIIRIYMEPLTSSSDFNKYGDVPFENALPAPVLNPVTGSVTQVKRGEVMDTWMSNHKNTQIIRKKLNSPLFNKFRPFPLGMVNYQDKVFYLERQPVRRSEQGLTNSMVYQKKVNLDNSGSGGSGYISLYTEEFRDCVMGVYPSATECLNAINNPEVLNEGLAFDRNFALVRGPIDMVFVAYKSDIVGVLPYGDFSVIKLGREFVHTKEVVDKLALFNDIQ